MNREEIRRYSDEVSALQPMQGNCDEIGVCNVSCSAALQAAEES